MGKQDELEAAKAELAAIRAELGNVGLLSHGYVQDRGPGAGGPCYQWTRKVKAKTVSAPAYLKAVAECVAQSLIGTRPWRVRHRGCGILPRRFGAACCFRFWECRSFGGREVFAAKDAKERKKHEIP